METSKGGEQLYPVPIDVFTDIVKIILHYEISHRITGINENENMILLTVKIPLYHPYRKEIKNNIGSILKEYGIYAHGTSDDFLE